MNYRLRLTKEVKPQNTRCLGDGRCARYHLAGFTGNFISQGTSRETTMAGRIAGRDCLFVNLLAVLALAAIPGCEVKPAAPPVKTGAQAGGEHHHHAHGEKGPHGGALVALGGHAVHLEVMLDE